MEGLISSTEDLQTVEVTFPNIIKNLSGSGATGEGLAIAATGDSVHVVWQDVIPGNSEIFYRRSIDGGVPFPT